MCRPLCTIHSLSKVKMANEIEAYQAAKREYESAVAACESATGIIHSASAILMDWKSAMVSNTSAGFPAEVALSRRAKSIDANNWKTAHEIGALLSAYHTAKAAMRSAYSAIPEGQREVVVPPPT